MNNSILASFSFLTAFGIAFYAVPIIIKVARVKRLYDKPGGRKGDRQAIPNLGGIAIISAFLIAFLGWWVISYTTPTMAYLQYLVMGLIILLFIGIKDDLVPLPALKKLLGQLLAASILVLPGKFRITDLHGIMGIHHLPVVSSILISIFAVVSLINAFNLIDGIDGLAGGVGLILSVTFAISFWRHGMPNMMVATLALGGALAGFLIYNRPPARIFMGDTGAMCIGYLMAASTFRYLQTSTEPSQNDLFHHNPAVAIAFLIIPLFDTLRVFVIRILNKKSPFVADRGHIHHKLLDLGLSHGHATLILCLANILYIGMAYMMRDLDPNLFLLIIVGSACALTCLPVFLMRKRTKKSGEMALSTIHVRILGNREEKEVKRHTEPVTKQVPGSREMMVEK